MPTREVSQEIFFLGGEGGGKGRSLPLIFMHSNTNLLKAHQLSAGEFMVKNCVSHHTLKSAFTQLLSHD